MDINRIHHVADAPVSVPDSSMPARPPQDVSIEGLYKLLDAALARLIELTSTVGTGTGIGSPSRPEGVDAKSRRDEPAKEDAYAMLTTEWLFPVASMNMTSFGFNTPTVGALLPGPAMRDGLKSDGLISASAALLSTLLATTGGGPSSLNPGFEGMESTIPALSLGGTPSDGVFVSAKDALLATLRGL